MWRMGETLARFTLAKRFAKIAAELMGVEGVRLYHDQALFKEPGGGHTPWHQDQIYWPLEPGFIRQPVIGATNDQAICPDSNNSRQHASV